MGDGISFKMVTKDFDFGMAERRRRMPSAGMYAVREAGRVAKRAGRAAAPVLKDSSKASHARLQRAIKKGTAGEAAAAKAAYDRPVPGLLKASISSSKRLKRLGDAEFSVKVGPRGPRTHLYAAKIEERAHFMDAAERAARAAMPSIAARAMGRVWKRG